MINSKINFKLLVILALAAFLRFVGIMHDAPAFFNPDERNMVSAITRFKLPKNIFEIPACLYSEFFIPYPSPNCSLNPEFFAYGQFPLYLAFASDQLSQLFPQNAQTSINTLVLTTPFSNGVYWLRIWSALASTLTVYFVYKTTQLLLKRPASFPFAEIAATLVAFMPGLIQSAHFGTTESLLTLFFMGSLYSSLKLFSSYIIPARNATHSVAGGLNTKYLILLSLCIGLALGSKLTGLFFFIPPFMVIALTFIVHKPKKLKDYLVSRIEYVRFAIILLVITGVVCVLSSPYNLVDPKGFLSSVFGYERDVAMGKYEAFYTRQFVDTLPLLFQFQKVFPYAIGLPLMIGGVLGFFTVIIEIIRTYVKKKRLSFSFLVLTVSFLGYLIPNAFLFAKWSRFMTPILPFFAFFSVILLERLYVKISKNLSILIALVLLIPTLVAGLMMTSIYMRPDSRFQASDWIYKNIPSHSIVLSETANVIDIPFPYADNLQPTTYNLQPISFDFYNVDINPELANSLIENLVKADYIFVPSRRIFANYLRLPQRYPIVSKYYENLFNGNLGFTKIAEISSYPSLEIRNWKLEIPDEIAEETFTVFDHPVIRIYKKNISKPVPEYRKLLFAFKP